MQKSVEGIVPAKGGEGLNSLTSRTAVVRTRMLGGVTGKAHEGLPMSISFGST